MAHSSSSAQELSMINNGAGAYFDVAGSATAANNFFAFRTCNISSSFLMTNALRITSVGNVCIGGTVPGAGYKLDVQGGDINSTGSVRSAGVALTSDQIFKTNIDSFANALSIINELKPRSYYFDTTNVNGMNFSNQKQYGLIAQDVEQVLP